MPNNRWQMTDNIAFFNKSGFSSEIQIFLSDTESVHQITSWNQRIGILIGANSSCRTVLVLLAKTHVPFLCELIICVSNLDHMPEPNTRNTDTGKHFL